VPSGPPDVVLAQRLERVAALGRRLRRPGAREVPAILLEHNTPKGAVPDARHPLADSDDWQLEHVTDFNRLTWESGCR
jgi:hypothetical protein